MKLNLAMMLTLFRIAAIPAVVVCFYSSMPNARPIAAILFGVAAITDFLDGGVARRYEQASKFGEFLDPIRRKPNVASRLVTTGEVGPDVYRARVAMVHNGCGNPRASCL